MKTGQIIRILDLDVNVQILCKDERGLLSIYLDRKPFNTFIKAIRKNGLKLNGLLVHFDKNMICVPALKNNPGYALH
jgi:hypothetical protein